MACALRPRRSRRGFGAARQGRPGGGRGAGGPRGRPGLVAGTEWPTIGRFALPMVALCLLMVALARHVATVAELREAPEEIAPRRRRGEAVLCPRPARPPGSQPLPDRAQEYTRRPGPCPLRPRPGGLRMRSETSRKWRARPCVRYARPSPATGHPRSPGSTPAPARCWGGRHRPPDRERGRRAAETHGGRPGLGGARRGDKRHLP
jgi:hypothetical protein